MIVLPYDQRYNHSGSGVLFEAIASGKLILISDIENLTAEIIEANGNFKVVDFESDSSFAANVQDLDHLTSVVRPWPVAQRIENF